MKKSYFFLFVLPLSFVLGSGCTIIGNSLDLQVKEERRSSVNWPYSQVNEGEDVIVSLRNGLKYRGSFIDSQPEPFASYAQRYAEWIELLNTPESFPDLGDTVIVTLDDGKKLKGKINCFDKGKEGFALYIDRNQGDQAIIPVHDIKAFDFGYTRPYGQEELSRILEYEEIPFRTVLVLKTENTFEYLSSDQVMQVAIPGKKRGYQGLAMGLILDTIAVIFMKEVLSQPKKSPLAFGDGGLLY